MTSSRSLEAKVEVAAYAAARAAAVVGLLILLAYAAMTLADGLSRSVFSQPIELVGDLGSVTVAVAVSCCFPLAYLQRSNITIKFFASRVLDAAAAVVVTVVAGLVARQMFVFAVGEFRGGDTTLMLGIKTAPFWFAVAAAMALAALTQGLVAWQKVLRCFHIVDPSDDSSQVH